MGKIQYFSIDLDNPQAVYFAGNMVTGTVSIHLRKAMEMREVRVRMIGQAKVHWSETSGTGKNRSTTHYRSNENYFDNVLRICGRGVNGHTGDRITLGGGNHKLPFYFELPARLPSSFEGRHGYVRYSIKVTIDKPWKFDRTGKRAFTVIEPMDLNFIPNTRNPLGANMNKMVCCCCCRSGPVDVDVHTDKTGYVPGESVLFNATINNNSRRRVTSVTADLYQIDKFITKRKTKRVKKRVANISGRGCAKMSSMNWNNARLNIPALPPSEMRNCSIIDVSYYIEFSVHLSDGSSSMDAKFPIIIGTVPLQQPRVPAAVPSYNEVEAVSSAAVPSAPVEPIAPPMEAPPPSYMSVFGGGTDIRDEEDDKDMLGNTNFAPQYPYYDWSQSAFSYS